MSADPMNRRNLRNAATFDKAREICETVTCTQNPDELADALEAAAADSDLAHAVMFYLVCQLREFPEDRTGVELVQQGPSLADLWTP